jgi:hypothetical protein
MNGLICGHRECDSSNCCNLSGSFISRVGCKPVSYDLGLASGCTCTIVRCAVM